MVNASAFVIISPLNQVTVDGAVMPSAAPGGAPTAGARWWASSAWRRIPSRSPRASVAPGPGCRSAALGTRRSLTTCRRAAVGERTRLRLRVRRVEPPRHLARRGWPRCRRRGPAARGEGAGSARGRGASRARRASRKRDGLGGRRGARRGGFLLLGKRLRGDDRLRLPGRAVHVLGTRDEHLRARLGVGHHAGDVSPVGVAVVVAVVPPVRVPVRVPVRTTPASSPR